MLAQVGELLDNPITGERGVIRIVPRESNNHLLVADLHVAPNGAVSGEHVHPTLHEAFTVVHGTLAMRVDGRRRTANPGDRTEIPPGQPHYWWNETDTPARVVLEVQPADRFLPMIRQLFGLARAGRTTAAGMPRLLDGVAMGREFADTIRFTTPPWPVQRTMFALLGPLAHATGHHGITPEYQTAPPTITDPDPLPEDILARIPTLADVDNPRD